MLYIYFDDGLNYLVTRFDTLQYLGLFKNKKQKEYEHKKKSTKSTTA